MWFNFHSPNSDDVISPRTENVSPFGELSADDILKFNRIKSLHFWAMIVMMIQFVAYLGASSGIEATTLASVSFQKNTSDDSCQDLTCSVNIHSLGPIDMLWTIPLFVGLAGFDHIICYSLLVHKSDLCKKWIFHINSNPIRWFEYSLSASLMAWSLAALCRITDIHLWFLIFVCTGLGMLCGWALELLPYPKSRREEQWPLPLPPSVLRNLIFSIGTLTVFTPWIVLGSYFFQAALDTNSDIPDFVYLAFLLTLVFFACFGLNSFLCHIIGYYDFPTAEMIYVLLSFTAKTFLAADVYGGLAAASD